jgi:aryl-alcohol dehydrogenase-like predicted oxidoreductase
MKRITRKEFLRKAGMSVLGGIGLIKSGKLYANKRAIPLVDLGNTGLRVSELCYGASRTMDEGLIKYAIDNGMNFLDTGRSYSRGRNEEMVGRAISGFRKDVVIQSKMHVDERELSFNGKGKKGSDEIRDLMERRLEESLKALQTDYIDIMLYHSADDEYLTYHDAVLDFFERYKRSGVITASGFSSHDYSLKLVERNNKDRNYDVIMHAFNHSGGFTHSLSGWKASWDQEKLISLLAEAADGGTGIVAMKTCSAGPFTISKGEEPSYRQAVQWVLMQRYVHTAAVAMSSYDQIDHHLL